MKFNLSIDMNNDWFAAEPETMVARILAGIQARICDGVTYGKIKDGNGNTCGQWGIEA